MALPLLLVSAGTLLFEVVLTRVFAVSLWGSYAFLVVSLALLGFGASGSLLRAVLRRRGPSRAASRSAFTLFFLSALLVTAFITRIPFDPARIAWDRLQFLWLSLFYLAASIPFLFGGFYVGSLFLSFPEKSRRIYGINLLGSAAGSLLALLALDATPLDAVRISPYKPLPQALLFPDARLLETRWGTEARVDLVRSGAVRFAPGLSLRFSADLPEQIGITFDGDRLNAVTRFDGDLSKLGFLGELPSAAPYRMLHSPGVLIAEPGGGLDILQALYHGASSVTALERSDDLIDLLQETIGEFSGRLYSRPGVVRRRENVRSYLLRPGPAYDLVVLSLAEGPSASSTGLYGLNENYLFTKEAFRAYLDRLTPQGLLQMTRYLLPPPREEPRAVALAVASLASSGVPDPWRHLAVIETYATWTLLMGKSPFGLRETEALRQFCEDRGFSLLHSREDLLSLMPEDSPFDLSPVSDDRPFFFHFFQVSKIPENYRLLREKWEAFFEGGYLVYFALAQALLWGFLLILFPALAGRRDAASRSLKTPTALYFFLIGLAFMFVEISFLQKATFLFGNPTRGIAWLLAAILSLSGWGSLKAGSRLAFLKRPAFFFGLIGAVILASLGAGHGWLSVLPALPLFYLMGLPFPLALERIDREAVPLAWAVNGVASVLGAILAVVIALEWGYSRVLTGAGVLYLLAGLVFKVSLARASRPLPSSARIEHR